ncbi:unnamed protein product [Didymodactylos carnosus]|uniref:PH domain-containing protein n=1 Tax=Didymodactylos carnosus TaxID=1234261 RepID=A0A814EFR7_9BILA|nr:unnamed protein product [Didymodactylos carnosus]CAF1347344.1 unnamed protein product [Didymodactylos carnosus]CAF3743492.1 unnamed protein product [Didymodactylos carnosus]CAF4158225.1 unnamed protein product [Didymodactylos carnosus]
MSVERPDIFKSGWLYRSSHPQKGLKWKRGWTVLSRDGALRFFPDISSTVADDLIYLTDPSLTILTSEQLQTIIQLPKDVQKLNQNPIFKLATTSKQWLMSAESDDDLIAWKTMFESVKSNHATNLLYTNIPNLQINSAKQIIYFHDEHVPSYIFFSDTSGHQNTVIIQDPRGGSRRFNDDFTIGALTGMIIWPFWIPFCFPWGC